MKVLTDLFESFGVDWPKFIAQTILFLIVYLILRRFAFASVISILEERRRRIEESQLNAEKIKQQLIEAESRYEEILRKANQDAKKMIDEAHAASEAFLNKETQRAIKDAENIISRAQEVTLLERQHMIDEVKNQMLDLVLQTTSKVVGKMITPEDQQRLTQETAAALAA
jgi:F-type H+-transporting ATPase subunit b